jgi:hypothetical protein
MKRVFPMKYRAKGPSIALLSGAGIQTACHDEREAASLRQHDRQALERAENEGMTSAPAESDASKRQLSTRGKSSRSSA